MHSLCIFLSFSVFLSLLRTSFFSLSYGQVFFKCQFSLIYWSLPACLLKSHYIHILSIHLSPPPATFIFTPPPPPPNSFLHLYPPFIFTPLSPPLSFLHLPPPPPFIFTSLPLTPPPPPFIFTSLPPSLPPLPFIFTSQTPLHLHPPFIFNLSPPPPPQFIFTPLLYIKARKKHRALTCTVQACWNTDVFDAGKHSEVAGNLATWNSKHLCFGCRLIHRKHCHLKQWTPVFWALTGSQETLSHETANTCVLGAD